MLFFSFFKRAGRADAIFLWLQLVLDDHLAEFNADDDISNLFDSLQLLPNNLDQYYRDTVSPVPDRWWDDMIVMFESVQCALNP